MQTNSTDKCFGKQLVPHGQSHSHKNLTREKQEKTSKTLLPCNGIAIVNLQWDGTFGQYIRFFPPLQAYSFHAESQHVGSLIAETYDKCLSL